MHGFWRSAFVAGLVFAAVGCAALRHPMVGTPIVQEEGSVTLLLMPRIDGAQGIQAPVKRWTSSDIHRLDVVPYLEVSPGDYRPLSKMGTPTTLEDTANLLRASRTSPLNLNQPIALSQLKPNQKYRVFAHAYTAGNELISTLDARSYLDVSVGTDDRPTMAAMLPVRLIDSPFAASTTVTVTNSGSNDFDDVVTSLVSVVGGTETAIANSHTIPKAQIPKTFKLDGLQAQTLYRMKAEARRAGTPVATASVNVNVSTDTSVSSVSLALSVPPAVPMVSTVANGGVGAGYGLARDAQGYFYVAEAYRAPGAVMQVWPDGQIVDRGYMSGLTGGGQFGELPGIAVDTNGNVYVGREQASAIYKITPGLMLKDRSLSELGTGLSAPVDVALGPDGFLYVADAAYNSGSIKKITLTGANTGRTEPFYQAASFKPITLAVSPDGTVYVMSMLPMSKRHIEKFSSAGVKDDNFSVDAPLGMMCATADGTIYVAAETEHKIYRYTPANGLQVFAGTGTPTSMDGPALSATFNKPRGVVHDPSANVLYVLESGAGKIRKITLGSQP